MDDRLTGHLSVGIMESYIPSHPFVCVRQWKSDPHIFDWGRQDIEVVIMRGGTYR